MNFEMEPLFCIVQDLSDEAQLAEEAAMGQEPTTLSIVIQSSREGV